MQWEQDHFEKSPFPLSFYPFPNFMSAWPRYPPKVQWKSTEEQLEGSAALFLFANIYAAVTEAKNRAALHYVLHRQKARKCPKEKIIRQNNS